MWWLLWACAGGTDGPGISDAGMLGSGRFWHPYRVSDAHVAADGSLLTLAGGAVFRWSPQGELLSKTELDGCTESSLNHGIFSVGGDWVLTSCMWVGEPGVWRTSGGARVIPAEDVGSSWLCGDALWDYVDGELVRITLPDGDRAPVSGDTRGGLVCVADQWLIDERGHRIDLDGTVSSLLADEPYLGLAGVDGDVVLARHDDRLVRIHGDGRMERGGELPFAPDVVMVHDGGLLAVDDDDQTWALDGDGQLVDGPWLAGSDGLSIRHAEGPLLSWQGGAWSWAGHRVFPVGPAPGPVGTTYEDIFFDDDELYLCRQRHCEARRLDDLDGGVRTVVLPRSFTDDTARSPSNRFLGMVGTDRLFRVEMDTGEVHTQPVSDWPDGISIDARGHFRWRLSSDDDEDDVYTTRVFERRDGAEVELGRWQESWLADPGWSVLRLGPMIRWPDGSTAGYADADSWFETPEGRVFLLSGYGARLEVFGPGGRQLAKAKGGDSMGRWADGAWVNRGRRIHFLGPDLQEQTRLVIPWDLGEFAAQGAASPDGSWFAAVRPDGRVQIWRIDVGAPTGRQAGAKRSDEVERLDPHTPTLRVGMQGMPSPIAVDRAPLYPQDHDLYDADERLQELASHSTEDTALVAMAAFAPRTQRERLALLASANRLLPSDEEVHDLWSRWVAVHRGGPYYDEGGEPRWPDGAAVAAELRRQVKQRELAPAVDALRAWHRARPLPEGPSFGVPGCHTEREEPSITPPVPPAEASSSRPRSSAEGLVVRVDDDGTPTWVGTLGSVRGDEARACWAVHDAQWTPATKAEQPVPYCMAVACREVPASAYTSTTDDADPPP